MAKKSREDKRVSKIFQACKTYKNRILIHTLIMRLNLILTKIVPIKIQRNHLMIEQNKQMGNVCIGKAATQNQIS